VIDHGDMEVIASPNTYWLSHSMFPQSVWLWLFISIIKMQQRSLIKLSLFSDSLIRIINQLSINHVVSFTTIKCNFTQH